MSFKWLKIDAFDSGYCLYSNFTFKASISTGFMGQRRKNHTFFYKNFFIEFYIFLKIYDIFDKNLENFKFLYNSKENFIFLYNSKEIL